MLRAVRVVRRSAVKARTQAANQLHALVITAPDQLRGELRGLGLARLVARAVRLRPGPCPQTPTAATKLALRLVAVRYQQLSAEMAELDRHLQRLVAAAAPQLLALKGLAPASRRRCCWPLGIIPIAYAARPPSRACVGWRRSRPPRAGPAAIG